ncbi:acetyltransferase, gnat family protein, partial [Staphylococcus simiae CCM 7213 = CCUG 51256]
MIRLGKKSDLDNILKLVEEAKGIMKEQDNHQWDDQYPLVEHFEEDIAKDYLYVLEENDHIYGFIVIDQ